MKAIVKLQAGPGAMAYLDREEPVAGENDVILRVEAAGICGSDLRLQKLGNSISLIPPVVMGHEFAGVISSVGSAVTRFAVGDRVVSDNSGYLCGVCENCAKGDYLACENRKGLGLGMDGGFTKYVKIPGQLLSVNPHTLFRIPENVSYEEATLMDPVANAYKAVIQEGRLVPGEDIVVYGMGTIGLLAVQIAKIAGANRIIAVNRSSSPVKIEVAKRFGATEVLCGEQYSPARVLEITHGEKPPLIVDCAGNNQILVDSLSLLEKNGRFVKVGYDKNPIPVPFDSFVAKGIQVIGHFAYNYTAWKNCLRLLEKGTLDVKPVITHVLPLDQWETGFSIAEKQDSIKVILKP